MVRWRDVQGRAGDGFRGTLGEAGRARMSTPAAGSVGVPYAGPMPALHRVVSRL